MEQGQSFGLEEVKRILKQNAAKVDTSRLTKQNSEPAADQPIIGYRLMEKMGSGGMGAVFKAENVDTNKHVALKLLYPNHDEKTLQQFINEGMMLLRLDHPNILKGLDFGVSNGFYFLATELVRGESLDIFLEKSFNFTEQFTFGIALEVAKALAYLEEQKIVHRDIKPNNILLLGEHVKICDFALCLDIKNIDNTQEASETTCGTVEYISPEQARGQQDIDSRSDVYSLGITCIHLLTGRLPFQGDPHEIMRQHIYEDINFAKLDSISRLSARILNLMVKKNYKKRIHASKLVGLLKKYMQKSFA